MLPSRQHGVGINLKFIRGDIKWLKASAGQQPDDASAICADDPFIAAAHYGGEILAAGIEDNPENYTRFFLIRKKGMVKADERPDKVSLAFTVENRPGTLVAALEVFARQGTNLTRIESRPVPGRPWEYVFYTDYQLSSPETADAALTQLAEHCSMVKELGRYRAARGGS